MFSLYLILAVFVGLLQAKSSTGDSVLVVLDNKLNRADYSLFFGGLESACERNLYLISLTPCHRAGVQHYLPCAGRQHSRNQGVRYTKLRPCYRLCTAH